MEVTALAQITVNCRVGDNLVKEIQLKALGREETRMVLGLWTQEKNLLRATGSLEVTWAWSLIVSKIWVLFFRIQYQSAKHRSLVFITSSFKQDVANGQKNKLLHIFTSLKVTV